MLRHLAPKKTCSSAPPASWLGRKECAFSVHAKKLERRERKESENEHGWLELIFLKGMASLRVG